MRESVTEIISRSVQKSFPDQSSMPPVFLERPKNRSHGDYATNIAMTLASKLKKNPREIAAKIVDNIDTSDGIISRCEIAGPGFINVILTEDFWRNILSRIHEEGEMFGSGAIGCGESVNIEFVSANPTGPLHVGHGRGAVVGDALATILSASGYDVTREYYVNDAGKQIRSLGVSICYRIREIDDPQFSKDVPFPEEGYQGEYVKDVSQKLMDDSLLSPLIAKIKTLSVQDILDQSGEVALEAGLAGATLLKSKIAHTLEKFGGISFNIWSSEKSLHDNGKVAESIMEFEQKGLIFEKDGASWFRSSQFGDEKDRVVKKEDGNLTYLAADIAYHRDKLERGYKRIIDVWGADHHGYIPRVRGAIEAMGFNPTKFNVLLVQMVTLVRSGKPVPMSKRSGQFVTLQEVIDEVGSDAARFFFLMRRYDSQLEFDLDLAKKTTADNPVYYVQYMHARICSILRKAEEEGLSLPSAGEVNLNLLSEQSELSIIKSLASFPEVLEGSAIAMEPHRITFFLQDLAIEFHSYYNKTRIVTDDADLSKARLYMIVSVKIVVKNALTLIGINAPERM